MTRLVAAISAAYLLAIFAASLIAYLPIGMLMDALASDAFLMVVAAFGLTGAPGFALFLRTIDPSRWSLRHLVLLGMLNTLPIIVVAGLFAWIFLFPVLAGGATGGAVFWLAARALGVVSAPGRSGS